VTQAAIQATPSLLCRGPIMHAQSFYSVFYIYTVSQKKSP